MIVLQAGAMVKYAKYFKEFHELTRQKRTGTLQDLADRFKISRGTAKNIVRAMKVGFNAPIKYDQYKRTFYYDRKGILVFDYMEINLDDFILPIKDIVEDRLKEIL